MNSQMKLGCGHIFYILSLKKHIKSITNGKYLYTKYETSPSIECSECSYEYTIKEIENIIGPKTLEAVNKRNRD